MGELTGKVALVTGASRGLGRAMALALGAAGADVAVTDLLSEEAPADAAKLARYSVLAAHFAGTDNVRTVATAREIQAMGVRGLWFQMDVSRPEDIREVVSGVTEAFGGVDILVNNAGVMDNLALLENQTPEGWDRDIRVNLSGAFHCARAVWAGMQQKQWGRIINISSFVGQMGAFAQPGYGASKAGLIGLSRSLALEGARQGITVNAVLPGFIETEAVKLHRPDIQARITDRIAMKRMGRPAEVAALVTFLASDAAGYITGAAIPVAGGADLFVF
ncbi:MAG: SDR family oxidoreductase [Thermodesulfobacteriota bacterium]